MLGFSITIYYKNKQHRLHHCH